MILDKNKGESTSSQTLFDVCFVFVFEWIMSKSSWVKYEREGEQRSE